ncbi:MAG: toll/interleukin-1 receptor domain-containing protein, partial [Thermoleophilia bacterium]|nr:toll/interleukin-1 receptor domain-containing protein [Thermoleophilia bacterium]
MKRGAAAGRVAGPGGRAGDPDARSSFQIVLNYRRDDTAGHAGRLYDALSEEFGEDAVFMDIDKIEPGVNFVQAIERAIDACDVFIALIGRQWLTATDAKGRKRLE